MIYTPSHHTPLTRTSSPLTPLHSINVTHQYDSHPSILRSSISYCALSFNDLLQIEEGDTIILVVDDNSYGFKKIIRDVVDEDTLNLHSREQLDESKYEFSMVLKASRISNELINGSMSIKEKI